MLSIRRAALRAASRSASLVAGGVSRQQLASLAMQHSKNNARQGLTVPAVRLFSQTVRARQEEKREEQAVVDEAIRASEEDVTTSPSEAEPARATPAQELSKNIYISNMTYEASEAHLREAFGKYGDIEDITIVRDADGRSRGFGFIGYADEKAAQQAIVEGDGAFWHGRRINVKARSASRNADQRQAPQRKVWEPTKCLYIGNIPFDTTDADLNTLFSSLDGLSDVRVATDRNTGWPRGFAHADFVDIEAATKALEKLGDASLKNRKLRISFASPTKRTAPASSQ